MELPIRSLAVTSDNSTAISGGRGGASGPPIAGAGVAVSCASCATAGTARNASTAAVVMNCLTMTSSIVAGGAAARPQILAATERTAMPSTGERRRPRASSGLLPRSTPTAGFRRCQTRAGGFSFAPVCPRTAPMRRVSPFTSSAAASPAPRPPGRSPRRASRWCCTRCGPRSAPSPTRPTALAELVCSNSFRSDDDEQNAVGLLHWEMRAAGGLVIAAADRHAAPRRRRAGRRPRALLRRGHRPARRAPAASRSSAARSPACRRPTGRASSSPPAR